MCSSIVFKIETLKLVSDFDYESQIRYIIAEVEQNDKYSFFVIFLQQLTEEIVLELNGRLKDHVVLPNKNFSTGILINLSNVDKITRIKIPPDELDLTGLYDGLHAVQFGDILLTSVHLSSDTEAGLELDQLKMDAFYDFIKDYPRFICGGDFNHRLPIDINCSTVEICFPNQDERSQLISVPELESTKHLLLKLGRGLDLKSYTGPICCNTSLKSVKIFSDSESFVNSHHRFFPVPGAVPISLKIASIEIQIDEMTGFEIFRSPIELHSWKPLSLDDL